MTRLTTIVLVLFVLIGFASVAVNLAGQSNNRTQRGSDVLQALIPASEQADLGLGGLTGQQRTELAGLLAGYYFAGLSDAVQQGRVRGSFEGWDGDTTVELADGTMFRQSEYHYEYDYSYSPDVTIFVRPFGYQLLVEDTDEPVGVELLRRPRRANSSVARSELFRTLFTLLPEDARLRALRVLGVR